MVAKITQNNSHSELLVSSRKAINANLVSEDVGSWGDCLVVTRLEVPGDLTVFI